MKRASWQTWDRWFSGWRWIGIWITQLPEEGRAWRRAGLRAIRDELRYLLWTHWRGYQNEQSEDPRAGSSSG